MGRWEHKAFNYISSNIGRRPAEATTHDLLIWALVDVQANLQLFTITSLNGSNKNYLQLLNSLTFSMYTTDIQNKLPNGQQ